MKKVIWPIVVGLLSTLMLIEAFTDLDILDKDKTVFCEEIVMDTVTNVIEIPGETIERVVDRLKIDTVIQRLYKVDTITQTVERNVRDTIIQYVDEGANFYVDSLTVENVKLTYGILCKGELIGFYPSIDSWCPSVKLHRWSVSGGYAWPSTALAGVRYRFNSNYGAQAIGGYGQRQFIGFLFDYSF